MTTVSGLWHEGKLSAEKPWNCGKWGHTTLLRVINCFSTTSTMYYKENTVVTCVVFHLQSLIASEWTYTSTSAYSPSTWPDNWHVDWSGPPGQSKQWAGSLKTGVFNQVVWNYFQALIFMCWGLLVESWLIYCCSKPIRSHYPLSCRNYDRLHSFLGDLGNRSVWVVTAAPPDVPEEQPGAFWRR